MEWIKSGFIVSVLLSMSMFHSFAYAGSSDSVLTPGAKIVPGDLSKNEFYILAKDEKLPAPALLLPQRTPRAKIKKPAALALNHANKPFKNIIHAIANKKMMAKLNKAIQGKDYKKLSLRFRKWLGKKEVKRLQEAINRELKSEKVRV